MSFLAGLGLGYVCGLAIAAPLVLSARRQLRRARAHLIECAEMQIEVADHLAELRFIRSRGAK